MQMGMTAAVSRRLVVAMLCNMAVVDEPYPNNDDVGVILAVRGRVGRRCYSGDGWVSPMLRCELTWRSQRHYCRPQLARCCCRHL